MFQNYTKYLVLQQKITDAEKEYSKIIKVDIILEIYIYFTLLSLNCFPEIAAASGYELEFKFLFAHTLAKNNKISANFANN